MLLVALLLAPLLISMLPVSANQLVVPTVIGSCVTVSDARRLAASGQLRPEYAHMTDAQLYALGFCADTSTTPSSGSCSSGYTRYTTSAGHCCQNGYPYYRDGSCYQCDEGYFIYDSSEGHCCKEGYPYYRDGTCYDAPADAGDVGTFIAVMGFLVALVVFFVAIAVAVKGKPAAAPRGAAEEPGKVPRKMQGMMQFGGDAAGRDIIRGPGQIPGGFRGPAPYHPAYTASPSPAPGEGQAGIPPSWPSAAGGQPVDGPGIVPSAPPVHPPVSGLQVARLGDRVHLEWKPPAHDPSREELIGYEVFRQEPSKMSTALERVSLGTVDPGVRSFDAGFLEGARFYNVRPIYRTPDGIVYGPGF